MLFCCTRRQSGENATRWKRVTAAGYMTVGEREERGERRKQQCVLSGEFQNPQSYRGQIQTNCECEVQLAPIGRAKLRLCWFVRHWRLSGLHGFSTRHVLSSHQNTPLRTVDVLSSSGDKVMTCRKLRPTEQLLSTTGPVTDTQLFCIEQHSVREMYGACH